MDDSIIHYTGGQVKDTNITEVTFEPGITRIDKHAFAGCQKLTSITIPDSVTSICKGAFDNCTSLKTVIIPYGVTKIESKAFNCCYRLQQADLPSSITHIGGKAFYWCHSLQSINIPKGVAKLGSEAFACSGIKNVIIQQGVKIIPHRAFCCCESLHTVQLPATVEEVGRKAFHRCFKLKNFHIPNEHLALKTLDLDDYYIPKHGWRWVSQLLSRSPMLEELSLRRVVVNRNRDSRIFKFEKLNDDDILMVLQVASSHCPGLRSLVFSSPSFTPKVFERLVSQDIPQNLRTISIQRMNLDEIVSSSPLLRCLDVHPKLAIWTNEFWDKSETKMVRHALDMNQFGFRGFKVPDSLWPILMERLGKINTDKPQWAANICYHLLHRNFEFLVRTRQRVEA